MKKLTSIIKDIPQSYIDNGKQWYKDANKFCEYLSNEYKVSFDKVCGVVSALSPANRWDNNKKEAENLIVCYITGGDYSKLSWRTYASNVIKAWDILISQKETESFFNPKTGAKTLHFYNNILNPLNNNFVTIDRHMIAILEGRIGVPSGSARLTPKQYKETVETFRKLAKKFNMEPCELQATLWEYHLGLINNN